MSQDVNLYAYLSDLERDAIVETCQEFVLTDAYRTMIGYVMSEYRHMDSDFYFAQDVGNAVAHALRTAKEAGVTKAGELRKCVWAELLDVMSQDRMVNDR